MWFTLWAMSKNNSPILLKSNNNKNAFTSNNPIFHDPNINYALH